MERFLGAFEHSFWLYDQAQPVHFASTAKLKGSFSLEQLRISLAKLQRRHPLLRVRIALDATGQPKFIEQLAEIPIRVVARTNAQRWQQELAAEMSQSLDWQIAPLVRVVLLQSGQEAELILSCHHSIGDGLSGALMLRDIVQELSGEQIDDSDDERLHQRPLSAALPIEKALVNTVLLSPEVAVQNQPLMESPVSISTRNLPHIRTALLSAELTQQIVMQCRREQTTVHGAISAAFLLVLARQKGTEPNQLKCLSPINVRSHLALPIPDAVGLYISYGLTHHTVSFNSSFWATARSVKSQLAELSYPQLLFSELLQRQQFMSTLPTPLMVSQATQQQRSYNLLVTNLGKLPLEQKFGNICIEEFYGPAVMAGIDQEQIVGVSTWSDRLSLTALSPSTTTSSESATAFLAEGLQLLEKIAIPASV
jgi:NRPS condensation-like uncharacterized protein